MMCVWLGAECMGAPTLRWPYRHGAMRSASAGVLLFLPGSSQHEGSRLAPRTFAGCSCAIRPVCSLCGTSSSSPLGVSSSPFGESPAGRGFVLLPLENLLLGVHSSPAGSYLSLHSERLFSPVGLPFSIRNAFSLPLDCLFSSIETFFLFRWRAAPTPSAYGAQRTSSLCVVERYFLSWRVSCSARRLVYPPAE